MVKHVSSVGDESTTSAIFCILLLNQIKRKIFPLLNICTHFALGPLKNIKTPVSSSQCWIPATVNI